MLGRTLGGESVGIAYLETVVNPKLQAALAMSKIINFYYQSDDCRSGSKGMKSEPWKIMQYSLSC
jgi:hypothetical protein